MKIWFVDEKEAKNFIKRLRFYIQNKRITQPQDSSKEEKNLEDLSMDELLDLYMEVDDPDEKARLETIMKLKGGRGA